MDTAQSSFPIVEPFAALFVFQYYIYCSCHHLTQPAGLASLHRGTGSMFFYNNADGPAVEGWFNSQRSRTALPI